MARTDSPLTQERLKALLSYDGETGLFTRLTVRTNALANAGSSAAGGYLCVFVDGKLYKAHRLAWFYVHGAWPQGPLDHRNGDRRDNRIANLRLSSMALNIQNIGGPYKNNRSSGVLGVYWHAQTGKWQARIQVEGRARSLGLFADKGEAQAAYISAKRILHPFWERPMEAAC